MPKASEHITRLFDIVRDIAVDVAKRWESPNPTSVGSTAPKEIPYKDLQAHPISKKIDEVGVTEKFEVSPKPLEGTRYFCGMRSFCGPDEIQIESITTRNGTELLCAGGIDANYFNNYGDLTKAYCDFDFGNADPKNPITIVVRALKPNVEVTLSLFSCRVLRAAA